jgi:YHS domain-containing protein
MHRFHPMTARIHLGLRIVGLCLAAAGSTAHAEIVWHDSLPTARTACAASGKPVLAIFVASWSPEATRFREQTLASPEVKGLIEACFEATIVDVDANEALTRRMEVAHVPSACIFGEKGRPLASFECPEQPLAFVAAASKAAQEAATARITGGAAVAESSTATSANLAAAGFQQTPGDGDPLASPNASEGGPSSTGSISLVTAKVRQLSDFATGVELSPAPAAATAVARAAPESSRFPRPQATIGQAATLPASPPDWPAERTQHAAAFTNASQAAPTRVGIEPLGTPPTSAAPWLGGAPAAGSAATASAAASDEPESVATASDLTGPPAPKSTWSTLVAAVSKPFTKPTAPATPPAAPPAAPPTMPPSKPASPVADAVAAALTTPAQPEAAPAADHHGSMPLGLEGYCPVTLADRGVWTEGRAQWGVRHRGRTYLFAGPEQQQAFLAAPDRYSPVLSGDDPVVVVDQGRSAPGRRAYGVTYQSRMYLFSSPETRAQFAANPERYTAPVMLAERPAPADATRRY